MTIRRFEQFWDRQATAEDIERMRRGTADDAMAVRSLQEIADIMNQSGKYDTLITKDMVRNDLKKGMAKIKARLVRP